MEVCCTLGMIEKQQALELKKAGLTAYNHNLDTSREYYPNIITTRTYDERLETLKHVREAGINVCSGILLNLTKCTNLMLLGWAQPELVCFHLVPNLLELVKLLYLNFYFSSLLDI